MNNALNQLWAKSIVEQALFAGINYFCIGYGSRNTPLILLLSNLPSLQTYYHFDERGLAFHALGYAKSTRKPAAIVVTSGSALANLYPAIMEAFEEEIPLLVVTADRPSELRSMGSNQTTDQARMFSNHVVWQCDYPTPDSFATISTMSHSLCYALSKLTYPVPGPVHINLMFREPLEFSHYSLEASEFSIKTPQYFSPETITNGFYQTLLREVPFNKGGIIVVGSMDCKKELRAIIAFAEKLHWPIIADVTSNIRGEDCPNSIAYYDFLLDTPIRSELVPSCIIHFGGKMVSKRWLLWNEKLPSIPYLHVSSSAKNYNPIYRLTHRLYAKATTFCDSLLPWIRVTSSSYLEQWRAMSEEIKKGIHIFFTKQGSLSELYLPIFLSQAKTPAIFIANSMPIRDADALFFPINPIKIFANRGVSGIDGNIGTAIGIAACLQTPLIAVVGDLASMHDLNSLLQLHSKPLPIIFIIINNGGGGIFSFLPVSKVLPISTFNQSFSGQHGYCFSHFATSLQFLYFSPNSICEFQKSILEAQEKAVPTIIEIKSDRETNYQLHLQLMGELRLSMATIES